MAKGVHEPWTNDGKPMTPPLPHISDLPETLLCEWLAQHGQPRFRARQIRQWLFGRYCRSFDDMTNLPEALRRELALAFRCCAVADAGILRAADGTVKFLFRLDDAETIETVLIPEKQRRTVCVSTQVGCPVRCVFCATGRGGFVRNLTSAEIIDQVLACCRYIGGRVTNIVVMGMGEPLLNVANTVAALERLTSGDGLDLGARRITVSTSGIPAGIRALAQHGRQWGLSLSLHAASDAKRARLIPAAYRSPIREIMAACREYREKTGRIVTLEYTLMPTVNDGRDDARMLAEAARDLRAKINLIGLNPIAPASRAPDESDVAAFARVLRSRGATVTVRRSRGEAIRAACGQLRGRAGDAAQSG